MKRIRLTVAYDGTNYCGWQIQPGRPTIEAALNRALTDLFHEPIAVIGASRTDSGVHARGNVAIFDTGSRIPADKICFAVNQRLPGDIRVLDSAEVAGDWHPRRANAVKTYEYRIANRRIPLPQERLYAYWCHQPLDVDRMREAARYLIGEHDFKSFCTPRTQAEETVRTIYDISLSRNEDVITVRISGSGFLYNMVRIIVGTLLRVGSGHVPPERVQEILEAGDRQAAAETAPARGLTLVDIKYEEALSAWLSRENRHWRYAILQTHIVQEKTAYFLLDRCEDGELDGVLRRRIHHAFQNGATQVYVADLERSRLFSGDVHGSYCLETCIQDEVWESLTGEECRLVREYWKNANPESRWFRAVLRQDIFLI